MMPAFAHRSQNRDRAQVDVNIDHWRVLHRLLMRVPDGTKWARSRITTAADEMVNVEVEKVFHAAGQIATPTSHFHF